MRRWSKCGCLAAPRGTLLRTRGLLPFTSSCSYVGIETKVLDVIADVTASLPRGQVRRRRTRIHLAAAFTAAQTTPKSGKWLLHKQLMTLPHRQLRKCPILTGWHRIVSSRVGNLAIRRTRLTSDSALSAGLMTLASERRGTTSHAGSLHIHLPPAPVQAPNPLARAPPNRPRIAVAHHDARQRSPPPNYRFSGNA